MIEIGFFYVDLGIEKYRPIVKSMVSSARKVMPDAHIVQLSDKATEKIAGVDLHGQFDLEINRKNLMAARTVLYAKHIRHAKGNLVYCDVDCLWVNPPDFSSADWDVGVLYRSGQPSMPYISCMTYTKPNERALEFWGDWAYTAGSLPSVMHGWWCDQVSLALLLGLDGRPGDVITHRGCRVGILDAYEHALIPTYEDQDTSSTVLIHYKGKQRKDLANGESGDDSASYARLATGPAATRNFLAPGGLTDPETQDGFARSPA